MIGSIRILNAINHQKKAGTSFVPIGLALLVMALSLTAVAIAYISFGHLPGYASKISWSYNKRDLDNNMDYHLRVLLQITRSFKFLHRSEICSVLITPILSKLKKEYTWHLLFGLRLRRYLFFLTTMTTPII